MDEGKSVIDINEESPISYYMDTRYHVYGISPTEEHNLMTNSVYAIWSTFKGFTFLSTDREIALRLALEIVRDSSLPPYVVFDLEARIIALSVEKTQWEIKNG